ncbi:MAG TPA: carboxypeptidase-like regulatory domain-containing protein, partial [Candidatus Kapabacteria bacterium]|nr:carboxypeptidase-like regulatory domain-containing protein [Candidatus Kapabacteria bacterium]
MFRNHKKYSPVFAVCLLVFSSLPVLAQTYRLSGAILDAKSRETLPGATIRIVGMSKGTISNRNGNYAMTLPRGNYTISVELLGYKSAQFTCI